MDPRTSPRVRLHRILPYNLHRIARYSAAHERAQHMVQRHDRRGVDLMQRASLGRPSLEELRTSTMEDDGIRGRLMAMS